MTLLVFLWGTLTFPRAPRTFWILLIAYAQIVILIKCFSQFEFVWWDKNHSIIKQLGNNQQKNFASYEIFLLMVVFLHRMVLKMFGIWKSIPEYELDDGVFINEESDLKTLELIKHSLQKPETVKCKTSEETLYCIESFAKLIDDEDDDDEEEKKILVRHELHHNVDTGKAEVKEVFRELKKPLIAHEKVTKDGQGDLIVTLRQDEVKLKLRKATTSDVQKSSHVTKQLVIVETELEEPSEFYPSVILMCLNRYFYVFSNLWSLLKTLPTGARKRVDVYKYMFFCEFINFVILLVGFKEFVVSQIAFFSPSSFKAHDFFLF